MDTLAAIRDQQFTLFAEQAVRQFCREVHEITYIDHGIDHLIVLANRQYVFRFPRSDNAVQRLSFETALLQKLAGKISAVPIPKVVHISHQPFFVVTQYVEGEHLTPTQAQTLSREEQNAVGQHVASFMTQLDRAVSGLEVQRLRTSAGLDASGLWPSVFHQLFEATQLPHTKLMPVVQQWYPVWKEYVAHEEATHAMHDDLRPLNLLFVGPVFSGILDFGDVRMGSAEAQLAGLYGFGPAVLDPAVQEYQRLSGRTITPDLVRVWAIMRELGSLTDCMNHRDTESARYQQARQSLRTWLSDFPL